VQTTRHAQPGLATRSWTTLKDAALQLWRDGGTRLAAGLTFYSVLSIFPALLVFAALVGLLGQASTVNTVLDAVARVAPPAAVEVLRGPIDAAVNHKGAAGLSLGVGLVGTLWAASGYVGCFVWTADIIWSVTETRPFWKLLVLRVVVSVTIVVVLALTVLAIVVTGPLARAVGGSLGMSGTAITVYEVAKWIVFFALAVAVFGLLYYVAPSVPGSRIRMVTPGALLGVVIWLVASAVFDAYVANFGSYNRLYGSLAGVVVFLLWAWLFNLGLLYGAAVDADLRRRREARRAAA
jgi:membrane protein